MPIWLRKFTFEKLKKHYEPEDDDKLEESLKEVKEQLMIKPPAYVTKATGKNQ